MSPKEENVTNVKKMVLEFKHLSSTVNEEYHLEVISERLCVVKAPICGKQINWDNLAPWQ